MNLIDPKGLSECVFEQTLEFFDASTGEFTGTGVSNRAVICPDNGGGSYGGNYNGQIGGLPNLGINPNGGGGVPFFFDESNDPSVAQDTEETISNCSVLDRAAADLADNIQALAAADGRNVFANSNEHGFVIGCIGNVLSVLGPFSSGDFNTIDPNLYIPPSVQFRGTIVAIVHNHPLQIESIINPNALQFNEFNISPSAGDLNVGRVLSRNGANVQFPFNNYVLGPDLRLRRRSTQINGRRSEHSELVDIEHCRS